MIVVVVVVCAFCYGRAVRHIIYVMAMDGVVMGCLCGYEQISLQKECTRFPTQSELTIVLIPY